VVGEAEALLRDLSDEEMGFFAAPALRELTLVYPEEWATFHQIGRAIRSSLFPATSKGIAPAYYWAALEILRYGYLAGSRDLTTILCRAAAMDAVMSIATSRHAT
jgi:hypothetical protein